jgi:hypothetical protein
MKSGSLSVVASTPNPSTAYQKVTFTAFVTPAWTGPLQPSGTVTFFNGNTPMATVGLSAQGVGTYETSSLPAGKHSITAAYNGDGNFETSVSPPREQVVYFLVPHSTLSTTPNPAKVDQSVTLQSKAYYPPDGTFPPPTGTVTFLDGDVVLGTVPLSGDTASLITSKLKPGAHTLTARYDGNEYYAASTSTPVTQTIRRITLFAVGGDRRFHAVRRRLQGSDQRRRRRPHGRRLLRRRHGCRPR